MDITDIIELEPTKGMVAIFSDDEEEIVYIDVYEDNRFAATHNLDTDKVMLQGWVTSEGGPKYFTVEGTNWDVARLIIVDLLSDPDYPLDDLDDAVKAWKEQINK